MRLNPSTGVRSFFFRSAPAAAGALGEGLAGGVGRSFWRSAARFATRATIRTALQPRRLNISALRFAKLPLRTGIFRARIRLRQIELAQHVQIVQRTLDLLHLAN